MSSLVLTVHLVLFRSHLRMLRLIPMTTIHASMKRPPMSIHLRNSFQWSWLRIAQHSAGGWGWWPALNCSYSFRCRLIRLIHLICFRVHLPLFFFIFPSTVEQAIQSSKLDFCWLSGGAMIDVWDPSTPEMLPEMHSESQFYPKEVHCQHLWRHWSRLSCRSLSHY